jgi:protocatechuate 3,4-dioxygenase beta subunit
MRANQPIIHLPNRREAVRLFTAATTAALVAPTDLLQAGRSPIVFDVPSCVVVPAQTEGPYFVDQQLRRADLRVDPASGTITVGLPLSLTVNVSRIENGQCAPLSGAVVDVWQCDVNGEYSDALDRGRRFDTRGERFLRGYQVTDQDGRVEFTTIYPGWYPGRAVHIHFKIRTSMTAGRAGEFTSQWYFDDVITDAVHAQGAYASKGERSVRNDRDGIYRRGGRELMLNLARTAAGYHGTFDLGVRL